MNTNLSRPSLGINQSALFQASNDLASCSLSRNEFAKNPDGLLNKYDLPSVSKGICIESQKTSEICTPPPVFLCALGVAVVVVGAIAVEVWVGAAIAVETLVYLHSIDTFEVGRANLNPPLSNMNYMGIC